MNTYMTQKNLSLNRPRRGIKTKKTNINVIDQYYSEINRQEELE